MKRYAALCLMLFLSCSESKECKFITAPFPTGVSVYGFNPQYDKPYGKYNLYLFLKNESGNPIDYPQIDADLFIDGKLAGIATGGPGRSLSNLDSAVVDLSYLLPDKAPDSVVLRWVEMN